MPSWTGYYIKVDGLTDFGDAASTTQSNVSLVGPYLSDDGVEDGTASINGSDLVESFVMTSGITFTIGGVDYTTDTASFGWEFANGEMLFSPDFSGTRNSDVVDALNASGGAIDSISFNFVNSNSFADPEEDYSLSTARYGGPVCFVSGTRIATPDGTKRVEDLAVGDLVRTYDGRCEPILWIGETRFQFTSDHDRHKPVLIPKGCLRPGRPARDLLVSPQHSILLADGAAQYLVPARWLVGHQGIRTMRGKKSVTYYHVMPRRHEIVLAENLPTETFFPGRMALQMIGGQHRSEIFRIFGQTPQGTLRGYETRRRAIWPKSRRHRLGHALSNQPEEDLLPSFAPRPTG